MTHEDRVALLLHLAEELDAAAGECVEAQRQMNRLSMKPPSGCPLEETRRLSTIDGTELRRALQRYGRATAQLRIVLEDWKPEVID